MDKFLKGLGFIALALGMTIVDFFMIQKIYNIVLLPHGAPALSMFQLWGVSLLIIAMVPVSRQSEDESYKEKMIRCFGKTIAIAISWGLASLFF